MWMPQFACPECSVEIADVRVEVCGCARCGNRYHRENGLWHFLTPARTHLLEPFLRQYRLVRERDGRRPIDASYYQSLPWVAADDPHASEWQIRRETYAHLLRRVLATSAESESMRILDLGAGNAWLSHRLAGLGHRVVAVDVLDDDADGLGALKHYPVHFAAVQADYDALPLAPAQFDLVVFNGSLHYAPDPGATLSAVRRMLAPGGAIAVMDSPMFVNEEDGRAMVAERALLQPGAGYLTYGLLDRTGAQLGLRGEFVVSRGSLQWRLRRRLGGLRLGRAPAAFGVWIAA